MVVRLLRLDHPTGIPSLHLHPLITVIDRAAEAQRRHLIEAVHKLCSGRGDGVRALVQYSGLLIELEPGTGSGFNRRPLTEVDTVVRSSIRWPRREVSRADLRAAVEDVVWSATQEAGESVPVVVDLDPAHEDDEVGELTSSMPILAQQAQLIVFTSDDRLSNWADQVGPSTASVLAKPSDVGDVGRYPRQR